MLKFKIISILVLLLPNMYFAQAQKIHKGYPKVILLQIRSENNRIESLMKAKRAKDLQEVIFDAQNAAAAMKRDFKDHFDYCPVYYFTDTNIELIKQKKFDGILNTLDGQIVNDPIIDKNSKDYFIVFYGYPTSQPKQYKPVKEGDKTKANYGEPFGKGLVINNHQMEQLSYLVKMDYSNLFIGKAKKAYFYESKSFEIEYYPLAGPFNENLKKRLTQSLNASD